MKRRQFAKRLFAFFGVLCVMYLHYRALKEMESSFGFDRPDGESTEDAETKADGTTPDEAEELEPVIDKPFDVSAFDDKPPPPPPPPPPRPPKQELVSSLKIIHHDHDIVREEAMEKAMACADLAENCAGWAASGECAKNPGFMLEQCKESCGLCGDDPVIDVDETRSMDPSSIGYAVLNSGHKMPLVGFGTAGLGELSATATKWALHAGYRLIDTAQAPEWYREDLVGDAVKAFLASGAAKREELFLTSKLHPRDLGAERTTEMVQSSLANLGVEYLDLFLLHYPKCWGNLCGGKTPQGTWRDSWRALETLQRAGKVRSIGVSNFDAAELRELGEWARVQPAVVQRNSDLFSQDKEARQLCESKGWQYEAYSSLGSQWLMRGHRVNPVLSHAEVKKIARIKGKSPAQVVLRWAIQHGQVVIPRSSRRARIVENLDVAGWTLDGNEMSALDALDGHPPFMTSQK